MASSIHYTISNEIFDYFPGYMRGVVLAEGVVNSPSPEELVLQLREAEEALRGKITLDQLAENPRIKNWREAYRSFGAKPSEFRSSIEAMTRRVLHGDPLPSINALVDIGNIVSLRNLLPAGGHAVDQMTGDIFLRPAVGTENFVPFGSDQVEHPLPGEIIFAEGETVLTRRWTWRQANHTLTLLDTKVIEFNVDGLPPVTRSEVENACKEVAELTGHFCGGQARYEILSRDNPGMCLSQE
jgi:DNA/RNA-binding domain of Phe-tRNA-synthetase-like protein